MTTRRYFIAGLFAVLPIWVTWLLLKFLFNILTSIGTPAVDWVAKSCEKNYPGLAGVLESDTFTNIFAILLVVAVIYAVGRLTTLIVGRRFISFFEAVLARIPLVSSIYGAVKKLVTVLQEKPGNGLQRVVLINFPSPEMKTVGLVTRVLTDTTTGRKLAAVYVPTTPNPTSGYLEIVPLEQVTSTNWTMDEAMTFIMSGGAVAPDTMSYDHPVTSDGEEASQP